MLFLLRPGFALGALAAVGLLHAQPALDASAPTSPVPVVPYRSVFADLPQGVEQQVRDWKAANATVGQFKRGHADVAKWEAAQALAPTPAATPAPNAHSNPGSGAAQPAPGPAAVLDTALGAVQLPRVLQDHTAQVNALLQAPLSADAAVRIALLHNPGLQSTLGTGGVALTYGTAQGSLAQFQARQAMVVVAVQAYKAWVSAVAAQQSVQLLLEAKDTLQTTGELARRMTQVGNSSKLSQARVQLTLADAALELARAQAQAFAAREHLAETLGLWGTQTQFVLPQVLPALPAQARELTDVEALALHARTDLTTARTQWQRQLASKPPTDVQAQWEAVGNAAQVRGAATQLRSQARASYFAYRSAYDTARYWQTEVLPLRSFVLDEMVLRYNGMLSSLFEVLADSQARTLAAHAALMAQRDFWLADADLQALLAGAPL